MEFRRVLFRSLPLAAGQGPHRLLEAAKMRIETGHDLARLRLHGPVVERAPAGEDFPSQKDIRGRVDIIGERQRLVDGLDAMSLGFRRMMDQIGSASCRERVCQYV